MGPIYSVNRLGQKFFPQKNKTLIGLLFADNRDAVEGISFLINNTFLPGTAFAIIIVCTVTLTFQLRNKSKWRKKSTSAGQGDLVSKRNQRVAKMVVIISTVFIACFIPMTIVFLVMFLEESFAIDGKHRGLAVLFVSLGLVLEAINSSSNIFVYHHMSSKYKEVFRECFCLLKQDSVNKN